MVQIFTNPTALEETTDNVELSLKQSAEAERLKKKLDDWQAKRQSKIIAYVGRFGSGKSTTLKSLESTYNTDGKKPLWKKLFVKDIKPIWLNFEAWRYTDREQLWEGFAIEAIDRVKGRKSHTKTTQAIDGISGAHGVVSRHPWISAVAIFVAGTVIASGLWWCLHDNTDTVSLLIIALLKYELPVLFVITAFLGVSSIFHKKEPLRRIFELENELEKALRRLKRPLVVVTEDIDRAGDEGIVFLETLRSFVNKLCDKSFDRSVIVIAPQDTTYTSVLNEDKIKGIERGIKIYDSIVYYGSSTIQNGTTTKLLDAAGIKSECRKDVIRVVGAILKSYKSDLSLRMLKFIFREAEEFAQSQDRVSATLAILIIFMRYVKVGDGTMQDIFRGRGGLRKSSTFSLGDSKLKAGNFMYDQLLIISGLEPDGDDPIYINYDGMNEEITGVHREYSPANKSVKKGFHITLHERYLDLLN